MALTPCAPCSCIAGNIPNDKFKQDVEIILCNIAAGLAPVADVDLNNVPAASVGFASIGAVYGTSGFTPTGGYLRSLGVQNSTDQDIQLSYDGGVTAGPIVPSGTFRQVDFAVNGGVMPVGTIFVKYLNGVAPTQGQVVIDGFY